MTTIHLNPNDQAAKALTALAFPNYSGRKFEVSIHPTSGMSLTSYWSGGSRSYYVIVRLEDNTIGAIPQNGSGFERIVPLTAETNDMPKAGYAVIEHQIFSGKDYGIVIHLHESNATKFLPAPETVSRNEKIVLIATRSLKSSYAGIKNYRFNEARSYTGITLAEYEAAKALLIEKKLLNKAGAITPEGRNAAGDERLYDLKKS